VLCHAVNTLCNLTLGRQCCEEAYSQGACHVTIKLLAARHLQLSSHAAKLLRNLLSVNVLTAADARSVAAALVGMLSSDNSDGTQHSIQCLRLVVEQSFDSVTDIGAELLSLLCAMLETVNAETQESTASIMVLLATHPSCSFDCGSFQVQQIVFQLESAQATGQNRTVAMLAQVLWLSICSPERESQLKQMQHLVEWKECAESIDRTCNSLMAMPLSSDAQQGIVAGPEDGLLLVHLLGISFLCGSFIEISGTNWSLVGRTIAQCGQWLRDWDQLHVWAITASRMPKEAWSPFVAARGVTVLQAVLNSGSGKLVRSALQFALDLAPHVGQEAPDLLACVKLHTDGKVEPASLGVMHIESLVVDECNDSHAKLIETPSSSLRGAFTLWQARLNRESILEKAQVTIASNA